MSSASNYTENNIISALLRGVAFPLPVGTYISLHTADPADTGANEVTAAQWPTYTRIHAEQAGAIGSGWSTPENGQSRNTNMLIYPAFDGGTALTVTHFGVYDAEAGGNLLVNSPLTAARTLVLGDVFLFDANALSIAAA